MHRFVLYLLDALKTRILNKTIFPQNILKINDVLCRLMSDMSRFEGKVERLTDQLASKERELQAITSKVY